MSRNRSKKSPDALQRTAQPAAAPAPRRDATAASGDAPVVFPFARTTEDDELRDLSGYGWGV